MKDKDLALLGLVGVGLYLVLSQKQPELRALPSEVGGSSITAIFESPVGEGAWPDAPTYAAPIFNPTTVITQAPPQVPFDFASLFAGLFGSDGGLGSIGGFEMPSINIEMPSIDIEMPAFDLPDWNFPDLGGIDLTGLQSTVDSMLRGFNDLVRDLASGAAENIKDIIAEVPEVIGDTVKEIVEEIPLVDAAEKVMDVLIAPLSGENWSAGFGWIWEKITPGRSTPSEDQFRPVVPEWYSDYVLGLPDERFELYMQMTEGGPFEVINMANTYDEERIWWMSRQQGFASIADIPVTEIPIEILEARQAVEAGNPWMEGR